MQQNFVVETFTPESISNIALMFQSGYLTVKEVVQSEMEQEFILAVPNKEVNDSMAFALLVAMSHCGQDEASQTVIRLKKSLRQRDEQVFNDGVRTLLAKNNKP